MLLVVAGFAGWRLIHRSLTLSKSMRRSEVLSPALGVVLIVVLGLVLGAVQLLPFMKLPAIASARRGDAAAGSGLGLSCTPADHVLHTELLWQPDPPDADGCVQWTGDLRGHERPG